MEIKRINIYDYPKYMKYVKKYAMLKKQLNNDNIFTRYKKILKKIYNDIILFIM